MKKIFLALLLLFSMSMAQAKGVYKTEEKFLNDVFNQNVPASESLLLKSELRASVTKILGHRYSGLRIKYWKNESTSAWILEEIGKDELITFGFAIKEKKISQAEVLIFRETRGWEIKYPAFTTQFIGGQLSNNELTQNIDGVTGATLSVWAMTSVAKLALFLDAYVNKQ
ncbi:MAG: FMN-binding protein [Methylophilaceae bacterium]|nr:FMN-binding protein [Methylophilaceae bacterium]MBL6728636.1 FMN-binding protein [Methylophilaceae bacterium]MBL6791051.1 FMN-binding protein [Methylophilaceae bacterium]